MIVIKRDGREVDFDKSKIFNAIFKAFVEVEKLTPCGDKEKIASDIATKLHDRYETLHRTMSVEEIQDDVEIELMRAGAFPVAKAYIKYRYEHELQRNSTGLYAKVLSIANNVNEEVIQENSNKNPTIISTQRDYIAGEISREITNRVLLPKEITKAHPYQPGDQGPRLHEAGCGLRRPGRADHHCGRVHRPSDVRPAV